LVYVSPYYSGDGDLRLETFWRYRAEVRFEGGGGVVRYRTATLPLLVLGPILFLGLAALMTHLAMVPRLRDRLSRVATEQG
jgi:hypothetical protein